ncbi:hypothetical protein pETSU_079 [Edwardsiella phage pEt-SU]|uniref:Uncharacterized protein n=1 Tax=Edwardsiella phage pEt-SU TaxID=2562142 RepID=A0A4D6DWE2_9CAUD|nr:hypothetical protein HOV39_gp079 [Edwardsiella phage pEt-SU]QBZ70660.1 hypothetical protein pETSU_079 [Edwardsiella phage pEt-SU]
MSEKIKNILVASQAIAIWVVAFAVVSWLVLKPSDNLDKETINKLTNAVDTFSAATESMNNLAKAQQEFTLRLSNSVMVSQQQREQGYGELYKKYGVSDEMGTNDLDSLYGFSVQQPTESVGGRDVRGNEDGAGKIGPSKNAGSGVKEQSH